MKKNKKLIMALAIVLALTTIVSGATFAWFTQNDSYTNKLRTRMLSDGSVTIFESFDPPTGEKGWTPGLEVKKEVGITNTGDVTVLVRVTFEELFTVLGSAFAANDTANNFASGRVPTLVNTELYTENAEYLPLAGNFAATGKEFKNTVDPAPSGVTIYYSKAGNTYKFVGWKTLDATNGEFSGGAQKVTFDADVTDNVVTFTNVKYWDAPLATPLNLKWANDTMNTAIGGTAFAAGSIPSVANIGYAGTDAKKLIQLNYSSDLDTAAMTAGKWWYNAADGWFYYLGTIASGETSKLLLESLYMDELAAGEATYKYLDFDLAVKVQAIQNYTDALTATAAWGLTSGSTIYNELEKLCVDYTAP